MPKYSLEFILSVGEISLETLKNSIIEFGENLEISQCQPADKKDRELLIRVSAEEPTLLFDACAQFGRIKSVKINDDTARI